MDSLLNFVSQHQYIAGIASLWVFCAAVDSMPDPDATSGKFYRWAYPFLHKIAGNLSVKFADKLPTKP